MSVGRSVVASCPLSVELSVVRCQLSVELSVVRKLPGGQCLARCPPGFRQVGMSVALIDHEDAQRTTDNGQLNGQLTTDN